MKSVRMVSETYGGIPADVQAFTPADEAVWFDSKDIQCLPAILATLKGLRAAVEITGLALSDAEVSIIAGESKAVSSEYEPAQAFQPVAWSSSNNGVAAVHAEDSGINAVIKGIKAGTATITASGGEQTAKISVTVV